jgi:hypothetical protein
MLYKNGEPYSLVETEIKAIERFFHNKFPVKITYPPERIKKSTLKHNRLPDKPNSISFDLKALVRTDKGTQEWRYAENVLLDNVGRKRYVPRKFKYSGVRLLDRNEIELIYFLLKKSPYRVIDEAELKDDKELKQTKNPKFRFEDLVTEAEKKVEKKQMEAKLGGMLYGEYALPDVTIKGLATACGIPNVEDFTMNQVKLHLEDYIRRSKEGPALFFDMVGDEDTIKIRGSIQKVIDKKILEYDNIKKLWVWKTKTGKEQVKGGKVPPTHTALDHLYDLYKIDERFREDIQAVLVSNKPLVGKPFKKVNAGDNEDEKEE